MFFEHEYQYDYDLDRICYNTVKNVTKKNKFPKNKKSVSKINKDYNPLPIN